MKTERFAYRLEPWRKQLGRIFTITVAAFAIAAVAMLYLSISEKMTSAKLQIQVLQEERSDFTRRIADLTTEEGKYTSYTIMQKRAEKAGYQEIDFTDDTGYEYVIVDGYTGTGVKSVQQEKVNKIYQDIYLRPEYTQSLQQWLAERIAVGVESYESDH